jgi:NAD(P)-dependent dehydrogenase (short-subunit alcohol dehydrogenase family)
MTNATGSVLVTGGLSGIGLATLAALSEAGFTAIAVDIATKPTSSVPVPAILWPNSLDVSDETAVAREVEAIEQQHGPLIGLVNAAGILGKMHRPHRLRLADWDREMAVDLRGTFIMCREVGTRMVRRRQGAIVNVASIVSLSSAPVHGYGPAKAAVASLTQTLAADWGPAGVRVNAVSPGFTRTPALEAGISAGALSYERLTQTAALGRLVEPIEVGRAIAWLIGPGSSAITGVNLPVDAGFLAAVPWTAYGGLRSPD